MQRLFLAAGLFGGLVLGSALAAPAWAAEGWTIQRFAADISIQPDASLRVVEAIDVDFGAQQKHGIFRKIPVRYTYDSTHVRVYPLTLRSVSDAQGRPIRYETSNEGPYAVIKIGDPNVLVTGARSYRIAYDVAGAMNPFADPDQVFWDVDGGGWEGRAQDVTAAVPPP